MRDIRDTADAGRPLWIRCTGADSRTPIHVNMAFAATFVAHGAGSRIWIAEEKRGIDVVETPGEIVEAMKAAESPRAERAAKQSQLFAFPLARPVTRGH